MNIETYICCISTNMVWFFVHCHSEASASSCISFSCRYYQINDFFFGRNSEETTILNNKRKLSWGMYKQGFKTQQAFIITATKLL